MNASRLMTWHDTATDVELAVSCGGSAHLLRWHRGEVEMLDHPEPDAEAALVALGGDEPRCLTLCRLWHTAVADGGFLEEWVDDTHLTRARLSWLATALERLRNEGFHEFLRSLPPDRAEPMGRFLHTFPRPWLDRAAAAVAEATVDGDGVVCAHASGLVTVAIAQRVRRAFVAAIGYGQLTLGAAALVPLSVSVDPLVASPATGLTGTLTGGTRGVAITVGQDWLHRVWAAGAGVIDGCLVLALHPVGGERDTAEVLAVMWHDGEPTLCLRRAEHDGDRWTLRLGDTLGPTREQTAQQ